MSIAPNQRRSYEDTAAGNHEDHEVDEFLNAAAKVMAPAEAKAFASLRDKAEQYDGLWEEFQALERRIEELEEAAALKDEEIATLLEAGAEEAAAQMDARGIPNG